jgi:hypothetical protein
MIEQVINRLNGEIEAVRLEAIQEVKKVLEDLKEQGEELYYSSIPGIEGAVIWLGAVKDPEGNKTAGGLFNEKCFITAYKIEMKYSKIEGSRNKHINVKAEINEISRDDLIDLLYTEQQKKMQKDLENIE